MQTAHLNVCKSTSKARAGSMLMSIISALHRGQAGRPIAANGMTDDRGLRLGHDASLDIGGSTTLSVTGNALGGGAVIIQVCASGGLKRESNSLAPALKLRRNQVALASHARRLRR